MLDPGGRVHVAFLLSDTLIPSLDRLGDDLSPSRGSLRSPTRPRSAVSPRWLRVAR